MKYGHTIHVYAIPGFKKNGKRYRFHVAHSWTQSGTNGQLYSEHSYYETKERAKAAADHLRKTYRDA
jgi:hypothetical protein